MFCFPPSACLVLRAPPCLAKPAVCGLQLLPQGFQAGVSAALPHAILQSLVLLPSFTACNYVIFVVCVSVLSVPAS